MDKNCYGTKEYSKNSSICKICKLYKRCGKIKRRKRCPNVLIKVSIYR
jgi:hypothetical protein